MFNAKLKYYFDGENQELLELSVILLAGLKRMLAQKGDIYLSQEPLIREKPIVQFARRMRIDGLEKFSSRTIIATVNFFIDENHMEAEKPLGALLVYIPEDYIARLMWLLDYGRIDEDNDEEMLDACGTVANLIAGYFVKELSAHGYIHLQMSHFETYTNSPLNGVAFNADEDVKQEMEIFIRDEKRMVLELTMSPVKRY